MAAPSRRQPARLLIAALAGAIALACAPRARADITVILSPATQTVAPGAEFDVFLEITGALATFNAFDSHVSFDPAALTAVPLSPLSQQIGPLMTGACSNLFHDFRPGTAEDTIGVSFLCSGVSVSGPGTIYQLHFLASDTPQATTIHIRTIRFFDAGLRVLPVNTADAQVGIGVELGVGASPASPARLALHAWPQPSSGGIELRLEGADGAIRLRIFDVNGRLVRDLSAGIGLKGAFWDGRDGSGAAVPSGLYFASAESMGRTVGRRLVIAR